MSEARKTSRRQFLAGKSAVVAIEDAATSLAGAQAAPVPEPAGDEGYLLEFSRRAMACQFSVFFNAGQTANASEAACAALDQIDALEDQLSIFRETSEISRINREAAEHPLAIEPRLSELLALAERISRETHGAYDISSGPLVRVWGFVRRQGAIPTPEVLAAARQAVGWQLVQLGNDPHSGGPSIHFLRPGMELNLGSIGKGYALDRAAEILLAAGASDFLLHGGNSSVLARGACVQSGHEEAWSIGLPHPYLRQQQLGQIRLSDQALSTSGAAHQFFEHQGRRLGHILDPRTGQPAEGVLSATALAPTAAEADALSTAFYVLDRGQVESYCAAHGDVGAILITPATRHPGVEIQTYGIAKAALTTD